MFSVEWSEAIPLSVLLFRVLTYYFLLITISFVFHSIGMSRTSRILATLYSFVTSTSYITSVLESQFPDGKRKDELENDPENVLSEKSFSPEVVSLVGRYNTDLLLVAIQLILIWTLYATSSLWGFSTDATPESLSVLWFLQHANFPFVLILTGYHIFWGVIRLRALTRVVLIWLIGVKSTLPNKFPFLRRVDHSASSLRAVVIGTYMLFSQQGRYPSIIHLFPLGLVVLALLWALVDFIPVQL